MSSLDTIESINRASLHEELTERLRSMIIDGVLIAGEKIPERALCEKLGVSRTPMREALKVLAADGLINLEPNRGARVRVITPADLEEVFPIMGALEALAGELSCANITESQLNALKAEHAQMLKHFHDQNMSAYFKHNEKIHQLIIQAAGNKTLADIYKTLSVRIRAGRYVANMDATRWQQAVDEHEEMIVALNKRNAEELGRILKRHLNNKLATVKSWVSDQESL